MILELKDEGQFLRRDERRLDTFRSASHAYCRIPEAGGAMDEGVRMNVRAGVVAAAFTLASLGAGCTTGQDHTLVFEGARLITGDKCRSRHDEGL